VKRGDWISRGFSELHEFVVRVIRYEVAVGLGFVMDGQELVTSGLRLHFITRMLVQKKRGGRLNPPPLQSFMATMKQRES
jgi:hypothetical protein